MQFPFNLRSSSPLFFFLSIVICRTDFNSFYENQLENLPSYFLIKLLCEKTVITSSSLTAWVRSCSVDFQCGLLPLSPSRTTPNLKERKKKEFAPTNCIPARIHSFAACRGIENRAGDGETHSAAHAVHHHFNCVCTGD